MPPPRNKTPHNSQGAFLTDFYIDKRYYLYYFYLVTNKVDYIMPRPKIIYKTIILNDQVLCDIFNGKPMLYGQACPQTNEIIIYRYEVDTNSKLPANVRNAIIESMRINQDYEQETIAHEAHHLRNWAIDYRRMPRTHYEYMAIRCMDEISAIAAGKMHLFTHPTPERVASELYNATNYYQTAAYLDKFIREIAPSIDVMIQRNRIDELVHANRLYQENSRQLYSPHFTAIQNHFFTYGTCMLESPNLERMQATDDWANFKRNMRTIKQSHFRALFDVIESKIDQATR